MADLKTDVLVIGGGNAAMCAALAARAQGVSVTVLERAPEDERGANSRFTEGSMRFPFNGLDDLLHVDRRRDAWTVCARGCYRLSVGLTGLQRNIA